MATAQASGAADGLPPVGLVLFDVFDTICTPRDPVHMQYYDEAVQAGIPSSSISPDSVRAAFRPAFKALDAKWPLYGKHSAPPLTPQEWWTKLIAKTMQEAGASDQEVEKAIPSLGPSLLRRFETDKGYVNFEETLSILDELKKLGVKTSVVSNADPRIILTLDALGITPHLSYPPTLSWDVEYSKPDPKIFQAACTACDEVPGPGVIMVGDELKADYRGALQAGIEGRLVRRHGEWSDGAQRSKDEQLDEVHVIRSLNDIVTEVKERAA